LNMCHCQTKVSNHTRTIQFHQNVLALDVTMRNRWFSLLHKIHSQTHAQMLT
jgi:hypothetical protein